ncbi:MAG: hypothetical protein WA966_16730 [Ornithinimicrobium sp.]
MTSGPDRGGQSDPVGTAVRVALASNPSPIEVARLAAEQEAIASAEVLPGLVKTFPPQVELVVTPADGGPVRVFDLVEAPDGRLVVGGTHPEHCSGDGNATPR